MAAADAFEEIKAAAARGEFRAMGDAIWAMGARGIDDAQLNAAIASATRCEDMGAGAGHVVHTRDPFGAPMSVWVNRGSVVAIGRP